MVHMIWSNEIRKNMGIEDRGTRIYIFITVFAFGLLLSEYWFSLHKFTVSTAQTVLRTLLLPLSCLLHHMWLHHSAYVLIFKQVSVNAWAGVLFYYTYPIKFVFKVFGSCKIWAYFYILTNIFLSRCGMPEVVVHVRFSKAFTSSNWLKILPR